MLPLDLMYISQRSLGLSNILAQVEADDNTPRKVLLPANVAAKDAGPDSAFGRSWAVLVEV